MTGRKKQMNRFIPMIKLVVLVICMFSLLALTGCSKVSKENYDKIKIGMSYEEVVGILGKPDTCEEPIMKTKSCMWGSSDKQIKIKFAADIVAWRSSEGI
jgi:hypothetical protein